MKEVPRVQLLRRIQRENPWWEEPFLVPNPYSDWRARPYLDLLYPLVSGTAPRRAVVLMGPRRVGKTVMIHHAIRRLLRSGLNPRRICYISVDHPLYNGMGLEQMLMLFAEAADLNIDEQQTYIFFDEIQYLKDWEIHLKTLVDAFKHLQIMASGSAAAALRMKSFESGAGRFTDFLLPPLTFYEYLVLIGKEAGEIEEERSPSRDPKYKARDIVSLNRLFLQYLNFGGYPEALFSVEIQSDPGRFIKSDIVDKVLLRDLPSLYGVQDIQELNSLFTTLAFNTANEISLDGIARNSGVAKNTIKRYMEYLEAAFLTRVVHRIDRSARRFKRANFFKVYLTNPSIRAALFSPIQSDDPSIGEVVETAVFSQWFHAKNTQLHYARWKGGEVDIVNLNEQSKPLWAVEAKWSDRIVDHPEELSVHLGFCRKHGLASLLVTTQSRRETRRMGDVLLDFQPTAEYCFAVGKNLMQGGAGIRGAQGLVKHPLGR